MFAISSSKGLSACVLQGGMDGARSQGFLTYLGGPRELDVHCFSRGQVLGKKLKTKPPENPENPLHKYEKEQNSFII